MVRVGFSITKTVEMMLGVYDVAFDHVIIPRIFASVLAAAAAAAMKFRLVTSRT